MNTGCGEEVREEFNGIAKYKPLLKFATLAPYHKITHE
jgi:hypothetical protein